MKYQNNKLEEFYTYNKHLLIREHFFECYKKLCKGENIENLINSHKKFINSFNLKGNNKKNKYKTLSFLYTFKNTHYSELSMQNLTNTINRMGGLI